MKAVFRNLSIRLKLILLMLLISGVVLALAAGSFMAIEVRSETREIEAELASLAGIIGFNCRAALVFADRQAAEKTLGALKLRPEVVGAWLLTPDGELFARYLRPATGKLRRASDGPPEGASLAGAPGGVTAGVVTSRLKDGSLLLQHTVLLDDELVGVLVLQADLVDLQARATTFSAAAAVILLCSSLIALLLASRLQHLISRPVVELTETMDRIGREQNYSLRLQSRSTDEVGRLIAGFNAMLGQVEERGEALAEANRTLEGRVASRTEELTRVNAELAHLLEEYRQAEATLRQSEEEYRALFENAPISFWEQDFSQVFAQFARLRQQGVEDFAAYFDRHPDEVDRCARLARIVDVNQRTLSLFGAADKRAFFSGIGQIFSSRSAESLRAVLIALAEGRPEFETEGVNRTLEGEERVLLIRYSLLPEIAGAARRAIISLLDITERRRAEEALRRSEWRFRSLFEDSPVSLWEEDFSAVKLYFDELRCSGVKDFAVHFSLHPEAVDECARRIRILDVNQATVRLYRAADKAELLGNLAKVFGEESYVAFRDELVALGEGRMSFETEGGNRTLDGEKLFVSMRLSVVPGYEQTLGRVIVSVVDLSGRRQTEEALRQSEERFRQMVGLLPQTVFEADAQGCLTFANQAGMETFGYLPEDLERGVAIVETIAPEERQAALPNLQRVLQGERVGPVERTMRRRDGSTFPALIHVAPILNGFEPMGMRGLIIDISERKQAEEAMRVLGKAIQTTQVGITITDLEGTIVFSNQAEARMHGYEATELLGRRANLLGPEELRGSVAARKIETWQRESRNLRKDGSTFPVRLVSDLVTDADGNALAIVTVCEDITERKEAEARLKASLVEKDVLLKEVHHRVKNNLQIISSLLNLQMKKMSDARVRNELNATRDRIRSMALIHAKLYQSENIAQIDFAEYVEEFAVQLARLHDVQPQQVRLRLEVEPLYLDVDVAIPCGMIINELLTNALKYAFPGERGGTIVVRLRTAAQQLLLSVEDDGVGIPPQFDIETTVTLGFQLVRALAQQLGGEVHLERNGGTRVLVQIPDKGSASD